MEAHCRKLLKEVDMCAASADTMHMASTDAKRALKQVKPMQCHGAARGAVLLLGACLLVCIAAMRANTCGTSWGAFMVWLTREIVLADVSEYETLCPLIKWFFCSTLDASSPLDAAHPKQYCCCRCIPCADLGAGGA
jgi:hypothetical protein